ncbi:MAG TPA: type II secretion system protein [Pyrinomonadaceae bacterium]|jgi:Tfp pilus assembly protein PilV
MTPRTHAAAPARPGERGFTLAETAIALLIMMIASVGVVSLFSYSVKYNAGAKDRELAMAVAQKRMEWLRGIPYNATTRGLAYRYPTTANPVSGGLAKTVAAGVTETATSAGRSYTVVTTITNFGNATDAASVIKTVTIQVTPVAQTNTLGQVSLTTQRSILLTGTN